MAAPLKTIEVLSIHTGKSEPLRNKAGVFSSIRKVPVTQPVLLRTLGFDGDTQTNRKHHGGAFKAVCAYASEYYPQWRAYTGEDMPIGSFGENIALRGLLDEDACVGDIFQLGEARIQISTPRGPCTDLSAHWNSKDMHLHTKRERKTGFYARVVQEGLVAPGDPLRLLERPHARWTLPLFWDLFDARDPSHEDLREALAIESLDPSTARTLEKKLAR
ncbi:MOSC domain-containing protein [soil metagenome]